MTTAVTTNALTELNALGAILKQDLMQVAGTPVLTLLQSLQTIAQQPIGPATVIQANAAWVIFTGNMLLALPNLEQEVLQQVLQWLIAKVQADLPKPAA